MTLFKPTLWLGLSVFASTLVAEETMSLSSTGAAPNSPPAAMPPASATGEAGLRFNFRGAPLETVLNYMSEAAGFIIDEETPVKGTVTVYSAQPVSKDEAVQMLNVELNKNGYSASVQGRTLIVSSKDDAKKRNIPIHTGNDPAEIPMNSEMVMQIIPLRHIDATQASRDLASLLPSSSTLTANADSNALIVTDTNSNIHHIVEIVAALDTSIETVSTLKVFKLVNADPVEMATLLTNLYSTTATQAAGGAGRGGAAGGFGGGGGIAALFGAAAGGGRGGGGGGGGAFPGGGGGAAGGGGGGGRGRGASGARMTPVVAVADPRTYSVVVTASKDQMPDIEQMVKQLDSSSARKQKVYVYTMENADVHQVETILKNLFQSSNSRSSTSTQADPLSTRATTNSQSTSSTSTLNLNSNNTGR
jgi:type II secretory pathway component GspD/PulD (secretin)